MKFVTCYPDAIRPININDSCTMCVLSVAEDILFHVMYIF